MLGTVFHWIQFRHLNEAFMAEPLRIRSVQPTVGFVVRLQLTDGATREIDLQPFLRGPIFEPLKNDPARFREVSVDSRAGTICWPNGADIDPDVLLLGRTPAWAESAPTLARD